MSPGDDLQPPPAPAAEEHPLTPLLRSANATRLAVALAVLIAVVALLYALRAIVTPMILALGVAYMLVPGVDALERRRIPRIYAVTALMIGVSIVIVSVIAIVVPALFAQLVALGARLPTYAAQLINWADHSFGLTLPADANAGDLLEDAKRALLRLGPGALTRGATSVLSLLIGGAGALTGVISFFLVPVFLFLFLQDWHNYKARWRTLLPEPMQAPIAAKLAQIDRSLSAYARGVVTVALILAVIYSLALSALGVPLGLLIGVLAGAAYLVPFLSPLVGIGLGVLFSLLEFSGWGQVLGVIIIFGVGNMLEGFFLTPRIVGDSLGLPPIAVILAVMIGGNLFGFLGVMLALPAAAVLNVIGRDLIVLWRSSDVYKTGLGGASS